LKRLLIVEDELLLRNNLQEAFSGNEYHVEVASDGAEALQRLDQERFNMVITDMKMPKASGLEVLTQARMKDANALVMVMTAYADIPSAVEAMRRGAYDYIQKPFDLEDLERRVMRAFDHQSEARQLEALREHEGECPDLLCESAEMKGVMAVVQKVAHSKATILITGETGTGKEMVAEAIHRISTRAQHSLVKVNCAALSEELIESELFGHERGAFTGALRRKIGRFELANEGTLFLDEVGNMSPRTQAKVLRALQDQEFERVGGEQTIKVDVRVVAATNRDLVEAIDQGEFRNDLFHRLSVVNIWIPPLRSRTADILPLAKIFLERHGREMHRSFHGFTQEAQNVLMEHSWPGNVRELKNTLERTVLMAEGDWIAPSDISLFEVRPGPVSPVCARQPLAEMDLANLEQRAVLEALERANWVQKDAAMALGISSRVINYKVRKYNFKNPRWSRNKSELVQH
jgi:two-component system response regulator AtoC